VNKIIVCLTVLSFFLAIGNSDKLIAQTQIEPQTDVTTPNNDDYIRRSLRTISQLVNRANYQRALDMIESLERDYGKLPEFAKARKYIYRSNKDYASLMDLVLAEYRTNPKDFSILCQLGEAYFLNDSLDQAVSTWEKAFKAAESSTINYFTLARYYQGFGFYDEAVSVYERARIILNQPDMFSDELSDLFIAQRNYAQAASEYLKLLRKDYNSRDVFRLSHQVITIFQQSDQPELIEQVVYQAIKDDPGNPNLYIILGDIQVIAKNLAMAFENYKKADSLSESQGMFLEGFVSLCYDQGEYAMVIEAANYYASKIKIRPSDKVGILKAKILVKMGMHNPAFELLHLIENNAIELDGKAEAMLTAGDIYANDLQNFDSASVIFTRLTEMKRPRFASQALMRLAEIDLLRGDFDKARAKLNNALINRGGKELSEKAAFLQAEITFMAYDFEKASQEYNLLAAQNPSGIYVNDCLDRLSLLVDAPKDTVLYFLGDAARHQYGGYSNLAIDDLKKASEFSDSKAYQYVLYSLAENYSRSRMWEQAAGAYEHYQTSFPEGLYIDRVLFNLAEIYYKEISRPDKADLLLNQLVTEYPASPLIEKARVYLNLIKSS